MRLSDTSGHTTGSCHRIRARLRMSESDDVGPLLADFETHVDRCPQCFEALVARYQPGPANEEPVRASAGRYELGRVLGAGTAGTVYEAHDPILNRRVAVKVLRANQSEHHRVRMLKEAQALARLDHPHVVRVHDAGEFDQSVYIAMELIDGCPLDAYVRTQQTSWRERVSLCLQAGRGLQAAHAAGLIHRDFKPSNVMVGVDGRVVVTDFGLASAFERASAREQTQEDASLLSLELTSTRALVGTPVYMAPERLDGQPATPQTDRYAWCVSLFEVLAGTRPFRAKTLAELQVAQRRLDPALVRMVSGPSALARLLVRELSVDPQERSSSMIELLNQVERIRRGRTRVMVGGVGLSVAVLAGLVALGRGPDRPPRCERPLAGLELENLDAQTMAGQRLRDVGARLEAAYEDVCSTVPRDPGSARPRQQARWMCLEATRHQLGVVTKELRRKAVHASGPGWWSIRRPEDCVDASVAYQTSYLTHAEPAAALTELEYALAGVQAILSRDPAGARQRVETLLAQAERFAIPPLVVDALWTRARAFALLGRNDDATADLYRAYELAAKHELSRQSGRVALALAGHTSRLFRIEESKVWVRTAEPLLNDAEDRVELLLIQGRIASRDGRYEAAVRRFDEAEALARQSATSIDWNFSSIAATRALAWSSMGEYAKAAVDLEKALAGSLEANGSVGPEVANRAVNLASVELQLDEAHSAFEHLQLARAAIGDDNRPTAAYIELNLGIANTLLGRFESAERSLQRAEALAHEAVPGIIPLVLVNRAATAAARGQLDAAIEFAHQSIRAARRVHADHPHERLSMAGYALSIAARIDRVHDEFDDILREALTERAAVEDGELVRQAEVGLSWARGSMALHSGDLDRARAAFEQALEQAPAGDEEVRALLKIDLARATRGPSGVEMLSAIVIPEELAPHDRAWLEIRRARALREQGVGPSDTSLQDVERLCSGEGLESLRAALADLRGR